MTLRVPQHPSFPEKSGLDYDEEESSSSSSSSSSSANEIYDSLPTNTTTRTSSIVYGATSLFHRIASLDSSAALSVAGDEPSWKCTKCSYLNVDTKNERCALCGSKDASGIGKQPQQRGVRYNYYYYKYYTPRPPIASLGEFLWGSSDSSQNKERCTSSRQHDDKLTFPDEDEDEGDCFEDEPSCLEQDGGDMVEMGMGMGKGGPLRLPKTSRVSRPGADDDECEQVDKPPSLSAMSLRRMSLFLKNNDATTAASATSAATTGSISVMIDHAGRATARTGALVKQRLSSSLSKQQQQQQQHVSSMIISREKQDGDITVRTSNRTTGPSSSAAPQLTTPTPTPTPTRQSHSPCLSATTTSMRRPSLTEAQIVPTPSARHTPPTIRSLPSRHPALRGEAGDDHAPRPARRRTTIVPPSLSLRSQDSTQHPPTTMHQTYPSEPGGRNILSSDEDNTLGQESHNDNIQTERQDEKNNAVFSSPRSKNATVRGPLDGISALVGSSQQESSLLQQFNQIESSDGDSAAGVGGNNVDRSSSNALPVVGKPSSQRRSWFRCMGVLARTLLVGGSVVFLIVLLSGGVDHGGGHHANNVPDQSPAAITLDVVNNNDTSILKNVENNGTEWNWALTIMGEPMDCLGSSVSVGGPVGNWIAMTGSNFVQVVQYASSNMEPLGSAIVLEQQNGGVMVPPRVSLSAERRRLVVSTNEGRLIVYQRDIHDDQDQYHDWESLFVFNATVATRDGDMTPRENAIVPTCGDISGTGLMVAGGALIKTTRGSFAAIQVWELEKIDPIGQPQRTYFEVATDSSAQDIDVILSYDGSVLAALANYSVMVYRRENEPTQRWVATSPSLNLGTGDNIISIALSGDGLVIALSRIDGVTTIFSYLEVDELASTSTHEWIQVDSVMASGATNSLALSYDGRTLLVGNDFGKVTAWRQQPRFQAERFGKYTKVHETTGSVQSSTFESSVSLPKNRKWNLWAVGACAEANSQNGQVDVYEMSVSSE